MTGTAAAKCTGGLRGRLWRKRCCGAGCGARAVVTVTAFARQLPWGCAWSPAGAKGAIKTAPRPQLRLLKAISDALVFREGVWKVLGSVDFQKMSFLAGLHSLNDRLWT